MRARHAVRPQLASLLELRAHAMCANPTVPEAALWSELSAGTLRELGSSEVDTRDELVAVFFADVLQAGSRTAPSFDKRGSPECGPWLER